MANLRIFFLLFAVCASRVWAIASFNDLASHLDALGGHTAFSWVAFDGAKKQVRSRELMPLGSGFKLYVLAALADAIGRGRFSWDEKTPILDEFKSLPSGVMQDNKNGDLFSLYDFAEAMIKISDNTATDHLINIVGRSAVEAQVKNIGNTFVDKNMPFLTTSEMFKIKWGSPVAIINTYIDGSESNRRDMLATVIKHTPLSNVGTNGISLEHPTYIRHIEWFGSTDDLCQVMKALKEKNSPEVMRALSQNVPLVTVGARWKYAGFKGGSEPGVITGTYLLQDHHDQWYAFAIAWHNEHNNLDQFMFFEVIKKLLKIIEKEIF